MGLGRAVAALAAGEDGGDATVVAAGEGSGGASDGRLGRLESAGRGRQRGRGNQNFRCDRSATCHPPTTEASSPRGACGGPRGGSFERRPTRGSFERVAVHAEHGALSSSSRYCVFPFFFYFFFRFLFILFLFIFVLFLTDFFMIFIFVFTLIFFTDVFHN